MKNISGSDMLVTAKPTVEIEMFAIEKLRSVKSSSGTSGSFLVRACVQTNRPRTSTPAMMSDHTVIGPQMTPQSYFWPSCSPNTIRNSPSALRKTPTMSNLCGCVSSLGTRIHASTKPMMPTGMLMKKIHSHPNPSTSRPPSSGPTSVATPAVAPHRPIAAPRRLAGNVRVMTAMVCGVMSAAPSP